MKNALIFLSLITVGVLLLNSCHSNYADELMTIVVKGEQKHLNRYNEMQRLTKDTNIINYIDTVKILLRDEANKAYGTMDTSEGYYTMDESKKLLKIYIDSCYVKK